MGNSKASRSEVEEHQCLKFNSDMCSASQIFTSVIHKCSTIVDFGPICLNEPKVLDGMVSTLHKTAVV